MKEDCLVDDMLDSWLREDDDVTETSGHPSWESLAAALKEGGFTGVETSVKQSMSSKSWNQMISLTCASCTTAWFDKHLIVGLPSIHGTHIARPLQSAFP